ncbi:heme ABC transporter ATP-binding protein [Simiduia agarivorans]|uniref:Hemin ABC transporter ATPase n=1 Tax=Simiduia agarivorans (strain DSM 21679 / JCM 13881 / BCRC 17597 / SA1) TaxID=1117647 RepID=K4KMW3_SIMAS|nr:heme ABC transporter ATP-binding protein [Simiduia agarivorans]AFV00362.1 hemin ABC transporter ATPase [Simiduia agarivorans SA1 = DSM 21679]
MLQAHNITVPSASGALLEQVSADFPAGKITALLGANGAGKSTLLKCLAGDQRYRGEIRFNDHSLSELKGVARARRVGVLPQASSLAFPFTAREVVALGATPLACARTELNARIEAIMDQCHCLPLAHQPYPRLSGGEKQRVQLARVLLQLSESTSAAGQASALLLLDEPTSAQDLGQQHHLLAMLRAQAAEQQWAVVAVLHDLNQVLRYCQHAVLLDQGKLIGQGDPQQLLTPQTVEAHWQYLPQETITPFGRALI